MSLFKSDAIPWDSVRRWSLRLLVYAMAAWVAWLIVVYGGNRSAYERHLVPEPFEYPLEAICRGVVFVLLEAVAVDLLLNYRAPPALWRRALIGGLVMLPISGFGSAVFWSGPPYRQLQIVWLWFLNTFLLCAAVVSAAVDFGGRAYRAYGVGRAGRG